MSKVTITHFPRIEAKVEPEPEPETGQSLLGYCPHCYTPSNFRERRPYGNDRCGNGHVYPSCSALEKAEPATELFEALDTLVAIVGLTAFKYEEQRTVLQEAVTLALAALAKAKRK